jgi:hypothetical protein
MTTPGGYGRQPAPRQQARGRGRQILWASVPVWSIGFLSPVPFLAYAVITRTRRDWAVFAGYLAATVAMIIALSATKDTTAPNDAVGLFIVALAGCAAAHAAVLFRPSRGVAPPGAAPGSLGMRQRNQAAVAAARDKLGRFVSAEELCEYAQLSPDRVDELRDVMIFT